MPLALKSVSCKRLPLSLVASFCCTAAEEEEELERSLEASPRRLETLSFTILSITTTQNGGSKNKNHKGLWMMTGNR